jgi:hypothetical protein
MGNRAHGNSSLVSRSLENRFEHVHLFLSERGLVEIYYRFDDLGFMQWLLFVLHPSWAGMMSIWKRALAY